MQNILAASDFSTRSLRALRRAGRLARKADAALTLVHVVDDDQPPSFVAVEMKESERYLLEQSRLLEELRDARVRVNVVTGHPAKGILDAANDADADLIVMGSHRRQAVRDVFVGTTVERIVRTGSRPVLMVNRDAHRPYSRVLAPVEAAEPSVHAIKTADSLGLVAGCEVTLLHAFAALGKGKLELAGVDPAQVSGYVAGEMRAASEELTAFLAAHGIDLHAWHCRYEEGMPFDVISRVAAQIDPDLIVIGTHGRSGVVRLLLGSVVEEVLRRLEYDILAVPPRR